MAVQQHKAVDHPFGYLPLNSYTVNIMVNFTAMPENKKDMNTLTEELKVKLIDILNLSDIQPEDMNEDAQLVGGELGIDSIDVLEMVVMVEKDYGVVINSQEVGEKVFSSLSALAEYIRENRTGHSN